MVDQHHGHSATFPYMLNGTGISVDISGSPHGHRGQDQGLDQTHVQSPAQMSPPDGTGPLQSPFMYHPLMDGSQYSYANAMHHGSPTAHLSQAQPLTLDPAQLRTPSVGPSRVLTRRQARMQQTHPYAGVSQGNQQQQLNEGFGFGADNNSPRPQTPTTFHASAQLAAGRIGMHDLDIGQITIPDTSTMSPQHPDTPASVTSSNFSHYGFAQYSSNGHSRSASSSTQPRSTSPAASVMSAATTVSSGSKARSGRARPPASSASAGYISVASFGSILSDTSTVKPKRRLQNRQRKEICQYFIQNPNSRQEDIASKWGVERSTVSKILKNKNRWLAVSETDDTVQAKHRPPKFAHIEQHMESWLIGCRDSNTTITDAMIRAKAREIAQKLQVPEDKFKASAGWVENYKHRANIRKGIWIGRPLPGTYSDDDSEDEGPYLHELIEQRERERAMKEADAAAQNAEETDTRIPTLDLESSPVTLNPTGEWTTSVQLTLGESNSTALEPQMRTVVNEASQATSQASAGNRFQQQLEITRCPWIIDSGISGVGGPPVSARDAYSAMDIVVRFVQAQVPNFLNERERNILTDIKHLIWVSAARSSSTSVAALPANATSGSASAANVDNSLGNASTAGTVLASTNASLVGEPITA